MKSSISLAVVAMVFAIAYFVFKMPVALAFVIGVILGALAFILLIAGAKGEHPMEVAKEAASFAMPAAEQRYETVEESLVRLNETLRLRCNDANVVGAVERLLDLLLATFPEALRQSENSEATYNLETLAKDGLPNLVESYLKLSQDDKVQKKSEFLAQIESLSQSVSEKKHQLDEGRLDDFEISSAFLKVKNL